MTPEQKALLETIGMWAGYGALGLVSIGTAWFAGTRLKQFLKRPERPRKTQEQLYKEYQRMGLLTVGTVLAIVTLLCCDARW